MKATSNAPKNVPPGARMVTHDGQRALIYRTHPSAKDPFGNSDYSYTSRRSGGLVKVWVKLLPVLFIVGGAVGTWYLIQLLCNLFGVPVT